MVVSEVHGELAALVVSDGLLPALAAAGAADDGPVISVRAPVLDR